MKLRHSMIALVLALGACDTMENDPDGQMLSINNDPAYFLPGNEGFIDLGTRVVSPGKIKVEIITSTRNGELKDLGKGLLQYSPKSNTIKDSFRFRVLSNDNKVLGEDSIGIVIPSDTTHLPCNGVYARRDSVTNVTGAVTVDVAANDFACNAQLTVTINVAPERGTATIVGNKIKYVPGISFTGRDNLLYKVTTADPSMPAGYALLWILGPDVVSDPGSGCVPIAVDDLFTKPLNDSTTTFLDVLANDTVCDSVTSLTISGGPHAGMAWIDNTVKKIAYKTAISINRGDTLQYKLCGPGGCATAKAIIKRQ